MAEGLSLRHQRFVAAYVGEANGNATRAAALADIPHPMQQGHRLLRNVEIQAAITEAKAAIMAEGVAVRELRMRRYTERWEQLQRVVAERAADPKHQQFPGGATGLLTIEPQLVKVYNSDSDPDDSEDGETLYSAKRDQVVYTAKLDTGLLREERDIAKQAAQDAGQWTEKRTIEGDVKFNVEAFHEMVRRADGAG